MNIQFSLFGALRPHNSVQVRVGAYILDQRETPGNSRNVFQVDQNNRRDHGKHRNRKIGSLSYFFAIFPNF